MNTRARKARVGIWGRRATDAERERLQQFVVRFEEEAKAQQATDAQKLETLMQQYGVVIVHRSGDAARSTPVGPAVRRHTPLKEKVELRKGGLAGRRG
jgi:hypothetical protein